MRTWYDVDITILVFVDIEFGSITSERPIQFNVLHGKERVKAIVTQGLKE